MQLSDYQREYLASEIVRAANLTGSAEGTKFVENFKYAQNIKMTDKGRDKILDWIRYSSGALSKAREWIKHNYNSPGEARVVYDNIVKAVNPPLN